MARHLDTPVECLGVRTPEAWRAFQRDTLRRRQIARPQDLTRSPFLVVGAREAYVGAGAWRVLCDCGEAPPAHPTWQLSLCSGCGASYEGVVFPDEARAIEAVLLLRRVKVTRNWRHPETVELLRAQNRKHGEPDDEVTA